MNSLTHAARLPRVINLTSLGRRITAGLNFLAPVVDLALRFWVATVFWKSGLTKIQSWDSTISKMHSMST